MELSRILLGQINKEKEKENLVFGEKNCKKNLVKKRRRR
jgi:hypothetical protein